MAGSFLDTTIVVHMSEGIEPDKSLGEVHVKSNQPAEMPYYALQELLTGRIRYICEAHNIIKAADNPGEAILALQKRSPAEGRKRETRVQICAEVLKEVFEANPAGRRDDLMREMLQALAMKAAQSWRKARHLKSVDVVQPLACFNDGQISFGPAGELIGPNSSFNCKSNERCAAAAYIYDNQSNLAKMIEVLHPNKLPPGLANKTETSQRRRALKELQTHGPTKFNKKLCRCIGDAYFAAMCPPGAEVVTTNLVDHEPLCAALGKKATKP